MKNIVKNFAIIIVLFFGICLFVLSNHIWGWRIFIVKSGSMEPQIRTGSIVISQSIQPFSLKKDDIITFISPTKEREFITHRITKTTDRNGYLSIKTQGDNNKTEDVWDIPGGSVVGKVTYTLPHVGYILGFAQSKIGILLFILIPTIFIIVEEVSSVITLLRKRETAHVKSSTSAMILLLVGNFLSFPQPTYSLLSDSAHIKNNSFTITAAQPTPTLIQPQPTVIPAPTIAHITPTPIQACKDDEKEKRGEKRKEKDKFR